MKTLLRWAASAAALLAVAYLVPGITILSIQTAFIAALVLGLVNGFIGPILRTLALPIRILTLGLFSLVINAVLFALAAYLVPGFEADGAGPVFIGAIAYGLISWGIQSVLGVKKKD
jgi:putative membrane protein